MAQLVKKQVAIRKHINNTVTNLTRRSFLASSAAASALSLFPIGSFAYAKDSPSADSNTQAGGDTIRPFHVNFPQADLIDLRRRIAATRWPNKETVSGPSQGVQLATMQKLAITGQRNTTGERWRQD